MDNSFVNTLLTYRGIAGLIWLLFNATGHVLKDEVRQRISTGMIGSENDSSEQKGIIWPATFIDVFDRVFIPWKRLNKGKFRPGFVRSCGASISVVILIGAIIFLVFDIELQEENLFRLA